MEKLPHPVPDGAGGLSRSTTSQPLPTSHATRGDPTAVYLREDAAPVRRGRRGVQSLAVNHLGWHEVPPKGPEKTTAPHLDYATHGKDLSGPPSPPN